MRSTLRALLVLLGVSGVFGVKDANDTSSRVMLDGGRYVPMWRGRLDSVYGFSYFTPSLVQNSCQSKKGQQCSLIPGEYASALPFVRPDSDLTPMSRTFVPQELSIPGATVNFKFRPSSPICSRPKINQFDLSIVHSSQFTVHPCSRSFWTHSVAIPINQFLRCVVVDP